MFSNRGPSPRHAMIRDAEYASSSKPTPSYSSPMTMTTPLPSIVLPDVIATPTGTALPSKMDFQSPMQPHARLASTALLATAEGKKALGLMLLEGATTPSLSLPMSCNFDALSHHFHLPLKVAAEKFGVRATAFKKRCRAIGIRHWPYRKVRSLKRSLQELSRCRDQGLLNDKQHHQLHVFQSQLDKLLSAETYGIDPNGRFGSFDDTDDNDCDSNGSNGDDDDMSCTSNQSPRVENVAYADFKIATLRTKRAKKNPVETAKPPRTTIKRGDFFLPSGIVTSGTYNDSVPSYYSTPSNEEPSTLRGRASGSHGPGHGGDLIPSVSLRFAPHTSHASQGGLAGFESYDPFFQDFKSEFTLTMEDFGGEDGGAPTYGIDSSVGDDFFPFIRSPTMATLRASSTASNAASRSSSRTNGSAPSASASNETQSRSPDDSSSEAVDDDVFLQISPDYGCLV